MGRVRGRGKRQPPAVAIGNENGSGEDDDKLLTKRRGRPQKPSKDDHEEEDNVAVKIKEDNDSDEVKSCVSSKGAAKSQSAVENSRKRKRPSPLEENAADQVKEENGVETRTNANATELIKNVGYRQNGSRRKNKPRRAAEVGVECN